MKNNISKKIFAMVMTIVMVGSMMTNTVFAASNTTASTKTVYTIDLNDIGEEEWEASQVNLNFYVNGQLGRAKTDGQTTTISGDFSIDKDLGNAVLLNLRDGDAVKPITFIPIRRLANILGLSVDWDDSIKSAILDTPKGRLVMPLNATVVTTEDGSVSYSEETYTYKGEKIPLILFRDGRVYTTVRFISSFIMPDAEYSWKGNYELTIRGTLEGTTVDKTYGINENYMDSAGFMNWLALPTLNEVMKNVNGEVKSRRVQVFTSDPALTITYDSTLGLQVRNYWLIGDAESQREVIEATLTDLICDSDRETVMGILDDVANVTSVGWTRSGVTAEAEAWLDNLQKTYSLTEITLEFDKWLENIVIKTK